MTGVSAKRSSFRRQLLVYVTILTGSLVFQAPAVALVKISDGFGDGDRNNDGVIASYDTDLNDSGTFNDPTADAALIARGVTEVTTPQNPSDVGIVWSATRAYDTTANLAKSKLRIFNDDVPIGSEDSSQIFH